MLINLSQGQEREEAKLWSGSLNVQRLMEEVGGDRRVTLQCPAYFLICFLSHPTLPDSKRKLEFFFLHYFHQEVLRGLDPNGC